MINKKLVTHWIKLQEFDYDSKNAEPYLWASDEVLDLSLLEPQLCFEFILCVLKETNDTKVLLNLAAGPLENLLSLNPEQAIELIEKEAVKNPLLKVTIKGVWQNMMSDSIWKRLNKII